MIDALRILELYAGEKTLFGAEHDEFYVYMLDERAPTQDEQSALNALGWFVDDSEPGCWQTFV